MGTIKRLSDSSSVKVDKMTIQAVPPRISPPGCQPLPCPGCRSPFFWFSIYDRTMTKPKCCDCDSAPTRSLAQRTPFGIAGPPGGPWWWESLADDPDDRIVFGGDVQDVDGRYDRGDVGESQLIEHTHHGHQLLTVVGSDSVAWSKDTWTKCLVFCWPELSEDGEER